MNSLKFIWAWIFIPIALAVIYFSVFPRGRYVYVVLFLVLEFASLVIWVIAWRHIVREMCFAELQYPAVIRWITGKANWKSKPKQIVSVASFQWMNGQLEDAYRTYQQLPEQELGKNRNRPTDFIRLVNGWKCFQDENIEQLAYWCPEGSAPTILHGWLALLRKDKNFSPEYRKQSGVLGVDLHNSYWSGFWYMANGEREKAIPKFLYVWENGDRTQWAEKARYALEGWRVALPAQKPAPRKAYKKGLIFLTVLTVCIAGLYLLLGNLL